MDAVADQLVTIPEANLWKVEEAFKKLTTRAKRTKLTAPVFVEVSREIRMVKASEIGLIIRDNPDLPRMYVTLQVAGNRPHLPGYTLVGAIQHEVGERISVLDGIETKVKTEVNILCAAPGETMPETYRRAGRHCDHCKTRRQRKDTFVLRNEAGEYRQIARNCLQDYLGESVDVKDIVKQFTWWSEAMTKLGGCGEYCGGGERRGDREDIVHYLAQVAVLVRKEGWTSRGAARDFPSLVATSGYAWHLMYPENTLRAELEKFRIEDQDIAQAVAALEWIRNTPEADQTGYIGNLFAACQSDSFRTRNDGLVASLVGSAYPKAMGTDKPRERKEKPVSKHLGAEGDKLTGLELTIKTMRYNAKPLSYGGGYTTWMAMVDADGNQVQWTSSNDLEGVVNIGDVIVLSGKIKTIKDHEKFGKQTVMTRCKFEVKEEAEVA